MPLLWFQINKTDIPFAPLVNIENEGCISLYPPYADTRFLEDTNTTFLVLPGPFLLIPPTDLTPLTP